MHLVFFGMYRGFKHELEVDLKWAVAEEWRVRLEGGGEGSGHPCLGEVWRKERVDRREV